MIRAADLQIVALDAAGFVMLRACGALQETVAAAYCDAREWRLFGKGAANAASSVVLGGSATTIQLSRRGKTAVDSEVLDTEASDEIVAAHGVRIATESDGSPLVEFLDANGAVFARAEFEPGMFAIFIGDCCDTLELSASGGLGSLPCKGSA